MARSTVAVRFTGDTANLKSSIGGINSQLGSLNKRVGGMSGNMKVGLASAGGAVGLFAKTSLDAASDTEESWSKMETVFGSASNTVGKFAQNADKIGLSDQKAADALGTFGNLFNQLGIGADQSADLSTQMVTLAADLGSFHNADISEVIEAQSSAFRGEYDALQRFIPTISAATVEQKALEQTGKSSTKELTAQEKALAVQALMMEGAGKATGDFARTSDSAANKQRVLGAKFDDLSAKVGQKLLPMLTKLADAGIRIIDFFSNLSPQMQVAIGVVAGLAGTVFLIVKAVKAWQAAQAALNVVLTMNPIGAVVVAVAAFVAGLVIAYQKVGWFRDLVDGAFRLIKTVISGVFNWVKDNWPLLLAILTGPIGLAVLAITTHWDTIKAGATAVKDWIVEKFNAVVSFFEGLPGTLSGLATDAWNALKSGLKAAIDWIVDQIDRALGPVDELLGGLGKVSGLFNTGGGISEEEIVAAAKAKGRARGGPVFAGRSYLVGERGPELLTMGRSGHVTPNHRLDRGTPESASGGNTYNITVTPKHESTAQAVVRELRRFSLLAGN